MATQGTQIISKEVLQAASTPPFVREAVDRMQKGDFAEARRVLEDGVKTSRTVVALLALAEAYWDDPDTKTRDPKRSIEFLKEAIQLAPKDARPYALLGRYLLSKGLRDQALNFLDRAIQLDPNDASSRRLRDRATLQKKKQYTVVVNAADFTAQKQKKNPVASAAEQHKKEATRFLALDPKRAAEELEKAERGENDAIDAALAALLGSDLVKADVTILRDDAAGRGGGALVRTVIAFIVVALAGLLFGGLLFRVAPSGGGTPEEQLARLLHTDSTASLSQLVEQSADVEGVRVPGVAALAHVLLLVDHGADEGHVQSAEDLLETAPPEARRAPEALYARALLRTLPIANEDPDLDADLDAAAAQAGDAFVQLALAERARQKGNASEALSHLAKAGFGPDAPPHALHELARAYAARGELDLATTVLERLWREEPKHGRSLITALAIVAVRARADDAGDEPSGDKPKDGKAAEAANDAGRAPSPIEARARKALDEDGVEASEAAPVALMLAALASARGQADVAGQMLQRAQEGGVPQAYPGLLSRLAQLLLLDLGDFSRAYDLLNDGLRTYPGEIRLLVDLTRVRAVRGLSDERIRRLRTNATRSLDAGVLDLPLGRFEIDFGERYLPLRPVFDARFFPEDAIRGALDIKGLTAQAAERRLSVVANLKLAELALGQNDVAKAEDHVAIARKEAPTNPEVHLSLALIHGKNGDSVRARESIEEALSIAPDDPRILLAAARLQLEGNDVAAARRSLNRLSGEGFTSPAALALAARVALKERDTARARTLLEKASRLGESDLAVLSARLHLEHEAGDFDAARRAAARVAELAPERALRLAEQDFVARAYLAWAALERGEVEPAEREIAEVLKDRQGFAAGHLILGEAHAKRRKNEDAIAAFTQALRFGAGTPVAARARERIVALGGAVDEPAKKRKSGSRRRRR